jgi:amino acid transporter
VTVRGREESHWTDALTSDKPSVGTVGRRCGGGGRRGRRFRVRGGRPAGVAALVVTNVFLVSVCVAIFVCCLAIQAACTRLLFAYGRDKMISASKLFGYVHPSTKIPLLSAIFVAVAAVLVLLYVNLGGSDPFIAIARVTAWATAGTYIAYQMVVFAGLVARAKGWPKDRTYFNLGKWGWPVNIIAFVYGVFMMINLAWPRTPDAAWYDNYLVIVSLVVVLIAGGIVYAIQRARGVDLSATIHEIDESPAEADAMEAMAAGEAGKVLPGGVSQMNADDEGKGGLTL